LFQDKKIKPLIFICEVGPFLRTDTTSNPQEHKAEAVVAGHLGVFYVQENETQIRLIKPAISFERAGPLLLSDWSVL